MKILIKETQEVKALKIETDPTDSLIRNYSANDEFKSISDNKDGWAADAEYEMSQEDFDWWENAVNNYNKGEALEAYYKEKYGDVIVNAVLDEYFDASEIGEDGANKILSLQGYFENDGREYHELSELNFLDVEGYLFKHDNEYNCYDFMVAVVVSNVLIPIGTGFEEDECESNDVTLILHGYSDQKNKDFDINDSMSNVHVDFNYAEEVMSLQCLFSYVYGIAYESKTTDGLGLEDAIRQLIEQEINEKA